MSDDLLYAPIRGISKPAVPNTTPSSGDIRVPQLWLDVIGQIRSSALTPGEPSWATATIAGGALRDLDQGRPVKDVDIFVPYCDNTYDRLEACLLALGIDVDLNLDEIKHNSPNQGAPSKIKTKGVAFSHFVFWHDGWKFEVTQKSEAFDHYSILDSFDIGLCMISLVTNSIYRNHHYTNDAANKTITVVRDTGGGEVNHAMRIKQKYSSWRVGKSIP